MGNSNLLGANVSLVMVRNRLQAGVPESVRAEIKDLDTARDYAANAPETHRALAERMYRQAAKQSGHLGRAHVAETDLGLAAVLEVVRGIME